jgi:hypothetical protein
MRRLGVTTVISLLICATARSGEERLLPSKLAPPVESGRWIVPAEGVAAEPIWGIKGGIRVGLWPAGGPRGLLRIYAPYVKQPPGRVINFIAIEPIVGRDRGLSELEWSVLDKVAGNAMWTGDEFEPDPQRRRAWQPARGRISGKADGESMVFHVLSSASRTEPGR